MECSLYGGDPPLGVKCAGCEVAYLPGMLCREQRTALTTARAWSERKRDLGEMTLRLTASIPAQSRRSSIVPLSCCDNLTPNIDSIFNYSGQYDALASPSMDSCGVSGSDTILPSVDRFFSSNLESTTVRSSSTRQRRSSHRYLRNSSSKLSEVFLWLCLFGLMHSACARATPTRHPSTTSNRPQKAHMERQNGAALWINPCGMGANEELMPQDVEIPYVSDKELLNQIVVQAKNALWEADSFKVDYVKKTFKMDYDEHHKSWLQNHYDWLPSKEKIPKALGGEVPAEHLKKIENNLDGTLADSYEYLQRFAVGLEQVARDQRANSAPFRDLFTGAEYKLRAVLCEIQVAIIERNVERRPDITRDIMSDEFRNLGDSYRNLRDWLIYRDYMNALEYVIKIFEFFSSKMP